MNSPGVVAMVSSFKHINLIKLAVISFFVTVTFCVLKSLERRGNYKQKLEVGLTKYWKHGIKITLPQDNGFGIMPYQYNEHWDTLFKNLDLLHKG